MTQKLSILNFLLIITAAFIILWITRIWTHPPYPSRIDGSEIVGTPKTLPELSVKRQTYPSSTLPRISEKNLFRKERVEFKVQSAEVQNANIPQLPPPVLKVKGIMLLQGTQVAVMEGTYSILNASNAVESKGLKKKGYFAGDHVGDYQVMLIDKGEVTLANKAGTTVKFKLERRTSAVPIQREGNYIFNKRGASKPQPTPVPSPPPVAAATPAAQPPAPAPHISGQ